VEKIICKKQWFARIEIGTGIKNKTSNEIILRLSDPGQGYAQLDFLCHIEITKYEKKLYQKLNGDIHKFTSETAREAMLLVA